MPNAVYQPLRSAAAPFAAASPASTFPGARSDASPSDLKPSERDEGLDPTRLHAESRRRGSPSDGRRPNIGKPTGFRRLDMTPDQRRSLVPLRLGPVVLLDSDEDSPNLRPFQSIDYDRSDSARGSRATTSTSTKDLLQPVVRPQTRDLTLSSPTRHIEGASADTNTPASDATMIGSTAQAWASSSPALRRQPSTTCLKSKRSLDRLLVRRQKSGQFAQQNISDVDIEVEREILELNTIVKEKRAEAARAADQRQDNNNGPAVAPAMQVDARSETLDAIGSALSRPRVPSISPRPVSSGGDTPLPQVDAVPTTPPHRHTASRAHLSGWLSSLLPISSLSSAESTDSRDRQIQSTTHADPRTPRRALSPSSSTGWSARLSLAELDSPSLTAASSSPTTTAKTHSRQHTGDSHLLVRAPAAMARSPHDYVVDVGEAEAKSAELALVVAEPGKGLVGLAL